LTSQHYEWMKSFLGLLSERREIWVFQKCHLGLGENQTQVLLHRSCVCYRVRYRVRHSTSTWLVRCFMLRCVIIIIGLGQFRLGWVRLGFQRLFGWSDVARVLFTIILMKWFPRMLMKRFCHLDPLSIMWMATLEVIAYLTIFSKKC